MADFYVNYDVIHVVYRNDSSAYASRAYPLKWDFCLFHHLRPCVLRTIVLLINLGSVLR